ncbi:uncharacterized protein LOC100909074 [Galendromus occidentalis]|uniref:Uncharacterized protein LOC100909074 n=1 Tax=Galendromus occidentalis TaxID=34638 RepID=A0AAJ6QTY9_9ACAR|nr:uncharacterized protein LOC100909074 [Galendromus occidentalis]
MTDEKKRSVAQVVFKEIIGQIRERRIKETKRNMESLEIEITESDHPDPAQEDVDLKKRLEEQAIEGKRKVEALINSFADGQVNGAGTSSGHDRDTDSASANGTGNGDTTNSGGPDGTAAEKEEDSSRESEVDESYLDTESSESENSEDVDCDEIIQRYGQDRERPRVEVPDQSAGPSNATNGEIVPNGIEAMEISDRASADPEAAGIKRSADIIELSSSDEDEAEEFVRTQAPRRVIPKRLTTLGEPLAKRHEIESVGDNVDADVEESAGETLRKEPREEIIEISDDET